jgi:hypothetical protein
MPDRIPTYTSQEGTQDVNPQSIVLPTISDGGDIFRGLADEALRLAAPYVQHDAEEAAARDVGNVSIVKDESGNFVRANVPKGGGLIYRQALDKGLDLREAAIRDTDFESKLTTLALEHRRDPVAFSNEASAIAESTLAQVPPTIRPQLESRWGRSIMERSRYIGSSAVEETENSLVRAAVGTVTNSFKKIQQIETADPLNPQNEKLIADYRGQAAAALQSLIGMGKTKQEVASIAQGFDVDLMDSDHFARTVKAKAEAAPLFAAADTPEKLMVLETWGNGYRTKDTVAGMTFDQFQQQFGLRIGQSIGNDAREKRLDLEAQQRAAAAAEPKPETASETIARINFSVTGTGTGVTMDQATYAAKQQDFLEKHGDVNALMTSTAGQLQVAGMLKTNGIVPIGTQDAISKLRTNAGATQAMQAMYLLRNQRFENKAVGETFFHNLPIELKSVYAWVEEMHRIGVSDQDIDQIDREKRAGTWRGLDKQAFAGYFAPDGKSRGYSAIRDQGMMKVLGVTDVNAFNATRPLWEHDFDDLMEANMNRFDNPRQALNATARVMAGTLQKSPWFWGGIGDSRVFHHGVSPQLLNVMFRDDPRMKGVSWLDRRDDGQPSVMLKRIGATTLPNDQVGPYEIHVFRKDGYQLGAFRVDMDHVIQRHDAALAIYRQKHADELRKDARPDPWIVGPDSLHGGAVRWHLNPAYQEWQDRMANRPKIDPGPRKNDLTGVPAL